MHSVHSMPIPGIEEAKRQAWVVARAWLTHKHFTVDETVPKWVPDDNDDQSFHACLTGREESEADLTEMTVVIRILCQNGTWVVGPELTFRGCQNLDKTAVGPVIRSTPLADADEAKSRATAGALMFMEDRGCTELNADPCWQADDEDGQAFHACVTGAAASGSGREDMQAIMRIVCVGNVWMVDPKMTFRGRAVLPANSLAQAA